MALLVRDSRIITPWLRDGAPLTGTMSGISMTGAGVYFTEVMDVGTFSELVGFLVVTAAGGTSMDVNLQGSGDGKNFDDLVSAADKFTQVTTTTGHQLVKFASNFGKYVRLKITLVGSGAYVFSLYLAAKG